MTILESVEELRAQIRRTGRDPAPSPQAAPPSRPVTRVERPAIVAQEDDTQAFRPTQRPTMALLTVLDDGDDEGEIVRIRTDSFVIGRVDGSLVIPHDNGISSRHAEISRRWEAGTYRWYLQDLQSTNGTFVRASTGFLQDGQELIVGGTRLRFEAPKPLPAATEGPAPAPQAGATRKWSSLDWQDLSGMVFPSLVELTARGEGARHRLDSGEAWIGRDGKACSIVLNDPMVSQRHARIYRDDRGRWFVQNNRSMNGLWMRIKEIFLDRGGQFFCGEQRFVIRVL